MLVHGARLLCSSRIPLGSTSLSQKSLTVASQHPHRQGLNYYLHFVDAQDQVCERAEASLLDPLLHPPWPNIRAGPEKELGKIEQEEI